MRNRTKRRAGWTGIFGLFLVVWALAGMAASDGSWVLLLFVAIATAMIALFLSVHAASGGFDTTETRQ